MKLNEQIRRAIRNSGFTYDQIVIISGYSKSNIYHLLNKAKGITISDKLERLLDGLGYELVLRRKDGE